MNSNSGGSEARKRRNLDHNSNGGYKLHLIDKRYDAAINETTAAVEETVAGRTDDSNSNQPCEGVPLMDWQEKYIDSLDKSISEIKNEIKETRSELKNDLNSKLDQFMGELRDRDNQRHLEIIAMNQRMDENIKELKADIKATKSEIHATNKWIIGLVIAAVLSFLGIAVSLNIGMVNVINIIKTLVTK